MNRTDIILKKVASDIPLAAKMVGLKPDNARMAFNRPGSKYHEQVVAALASIIKNREQLINTHQSL